MARNDIYVNINATSPADCIVVGQQDMTAADIPELVLGDTPTFNFYFTDNTNVWPSWAGNAAYSVTWALSDAVSGDFAPAATTGNATPITGGWSIVLPLNSYDLVGLLNTKRVSQPYPVTNLWQQIRITDPAGKEVTRALVYTPIRYRAISDTQNTESASPTGGRFVTVDNTNGLTTPTLAQFYDANPVPASALPLGLGTDTAPANGELLIGNGSGYVTSTLTAGTGVSITNGPGSITIDATNAQELLTATVKNAEATPITKGQVVYLYSATGNMPSVKLAANTSDATSAKTFGVVSSTSIAANGTGTVTCVGVVDGLNLGAYNDGDTVYLGATPGSITATKPYAPNHLVYVGIIERANAGNGELYVKVQNGYELDEIHDVQITSAPAAGALLMRDATNSLWKANRLSAGTNIAITNADTSVTVGLTGTVAVANGGTGVTTSTGSGSVVLSTSPSLTTPILGTPQSGTLTNCTGLPVSTGVSGLGSGVATFLATPTSANLRSVVTDETGTGALVFANTPSLVTPDIGAATGTSVSLTGNATVSDVTFGTSGPSAKSSIAARASRQGLVFDGTAGATVSVPAFGTSDFTISAWVNATALADNKAICDGVNSLGIWLKASGAIQLWNRVGGTALYTSAASTVATGKTYLITYARGRLYVNGLDVSGAITDTTNYSGGITAIGDVFNTGAPFSGLLSVLIYNRALTAAEVVALYEQGVPSGADYNSASNTSKVAATFASGWTAAGGATLAATATIPNGATVYQANLQTPGKKVRFTVTVDSISAGVIQYYNGSAYVTFASTPGTYTIEYTSGSTVNQLIFAAVGGTVVLSSPSVFWIGLLLAPDAAQAGGGLVWYDTSGNAANITLPASGVTWNVPTSAKTASGWTFGGTVTGSAAGPSLGTGVNTQNFLASAGSGFVGYSLRRTDDTNGGWLIGTSAAVVGDFAIYQNQGASTVPVQRLLIGTTGNTTLAGNLTVSGTGTSSFGGPLTVDRSSSGTVGILKASSVGAGGQVNLFLGKSDSTYNCLTLIYKHIGDGSSSNYVGLGFYGNDNLLNIVANGNVLVGTTTDSGNGKLQLATHTTSAGGIGFGTDTTLYRTAAGELYSSSTGTNSFYGFVDSGGLKGIIGTSVGDMYVGTQTAKSVYIRTNATTALTLDSSQRCILSGALRLNNAYTASVVVPTGYVTIQDSTGTTYKVCVLL